MLEGLEISEIKKSQLNETLRTEAEYYRKAYLVVEAQLKRKGSIILSSLISKISDGTHFTPKYTETGVPFLSALNVLENRIDMGAGHQFISAEEHSKLYRRCDPKQSDVLLRKVGVGPRWAAVIPEGLPVFSIFVSVAMLRTRNELLAPEVLATFINSKIGQSQLLRVQKGASQPDLHLEDIRDVLVPVFGDELQKKVTGIYQEASFKFGKGLVCYKNAELLLLETLGMANFSPSAEKVNIKSFKDSFAATSRLDAEYYQPRFEEYNQLISANPQGFTTVSHEYDLVKTASRRDKATYNYIEIGDVDVSSGSASFNRVERDELPDNAKLEAMRGDLLISKVRPNRGAVAIINFDDTDLIVSGAFTVLREKAGSIFANETLKVLLRTAIYKDWLLKFNVGTQYPVIRDEDILNLPIPKIDVETQTKIAALVQQSFALKAQSERLLDAAKQAVETAIETNEDAALACLTSIY